jgi:hypothetical protein
MKLITPEECVIHPKQIKILRPEDDTLNKKEKK